MSLYQFGRDLANSKIHGKKKKMLQARISHLLVGVSHNILAPGASKRPRITLSYNQTHAAHHYATRIALDTCLQRPISGAPYKS